MSKDPRPRARISNGQCFSFLYFQLLLVSKTSESAQCYFSLPVPFMQERKVCTTMYLSTLAASGRDGLKLVRCMLVNASDVLSLHACATAGTRAYKSQSAQPEVPEPLASKLGLPTAEGPAIALDPPFPQVDERYHIKTTSDDVPSTTYASRLSQRSRVHACREMQLIARHM